jgi:hypothetical protein
MNMRNIIWGALLCTLPSIGFAQITQSHSSDKSPVYDDLISLVREIQDQTINFQNAIDLEHPGDLVAFKFAQKDISKRLEIAILNLGTAKLLVEEYALRLAQPSMQSNLNARAALTASYSNSIETHYHKAIKQLIFIEGTKPGFRDQAGFQDAVRNCITESCVVKIRESYDELLSFGKAMNRDLKFKNMHNESKVYWDFKDPLVRNSISETFNRMIKPNQEVSAYRVVYAGIFAPLSYIGTALYNSVTGALNVRVTTIKIDVRKLEGFSVNQISKELDTILRKEIFDLAIDRVQNKRIMNFQQSKANDLLHKIEKDLKKSKKCYALVVERQNRDLLYTDNIGEVHQVWDYELYIYGPLLLKEKILFRAELFEGNYYSYPAVLKMLEAIETNNCIK